MTSYDQIDDEDKLHEMMNKVDNFDERRKIRGRLRELRDKKMKQWEEKRLENEKVADNVLKDKVRRADEDKLRKMQQYKENANITKNMEDLRLRASQEGLKDRQKQADEEKRRKLEAYDQMAKKVETSTKDGTTTTTTTTATSESTGDGKKTTVIKKTETVSRTVGNSGGPAGKPAGGAMAAFKQLDASNPPKNLAPAKPLSRSPSAIKQMLLEWTKAMTQEYADKIVITNFSSSWNNGIAFCALIHHFYPEAFDFDALDPKKRRHNFDLAFDTAEKYADIAPLLDTDDMVRMQKPDWKCVFTYVQSFYRKLQKHENNKVMPKDM